MELLVDKNYIRIWITALLLLLPTLFYAQEWTLNLEGAVTSDNDRSKMEGVKIMVFRNGAKSDQVVTDSKGKFLIALPPDAKYLLEFQSPGYVTKRISFSTKFVPPEHVEQNPAFLFRFDMSLFKEIPGLDISILNKPVAEVTYDPQLLDFNYDKEYSKSIKTQVEKLKADMEAAMAAAAAAEKEIEKNYQSAMADALKAESRNDFNQAIGFYEAALAIKPGDASASSKKDAAQKKYDKEMAEKNKEKAYTEAIENAESAVYNKDYKKAEVEFQKALDVKPGDTYARDQLKEIRDVMVNAAKAEQTYFAAISKGDQAMQVKDYITAKAEYIKAKDAKPDEEYPKIQLEQVEALLVADAKREVDYVNAVERGETSMESGDYEAAKAAFEQAAQIKPTEKYPKEQIAKIAGILSEITLKNNNYAAAIKKADDALTKNEFQNAKKGYEEALGIKPGEQYPKDQIAAIVAKLDEMAKKDQKYAELIKEADVRFDAKDFIAAKAEYNKALEVKPGESHPTSRIAEISTILEADAKLEKEYKQAIENADNAFNGKDYNSAKFEYQAASNLKPNEAYPKEKLLAINGLLADLAKKDEDYNKAIKAGDDAFASADFELAKTSYTAALVIKPKEEYPLDQMEKVKAKIIELANLNKEYDATIASADKLMTANNLESAKAEYEKALSLKPSESYPKEKIAAITGLLADAQKKDQEYQKYITDGDAAFASKNYQGSKSAFESASQLKPTEKYPKDKIVEIDKLLVEMAQVAASYDAAIKKADEAFKANNLVAALPLYKEAAGIKEGESYPIQQITLIEAKLDELKKLDENYAIAIAKAESSEKAKEYDVALATYKEAGILKPDEAYPKEKITALTAIIAENQKKNAAYDEALTLGDQALKGAEYDIALTQFKKASELKPEESYPKEKIKETESMKASALAAIELANKQQAQYDALIAEGDELMKKADYAASKTKFQAALDVKPTEVYPKTKIGEIDNLMADAAEKAARNEKYQSLIASADKSFASKDWNGAKAGYLEAQKVKPEETYPAAQLKAIEASIAAELALASQQEQEAAAKAKEEKYNTLIAAGDASFKSKDWESAKSSYREAQSVKTEEAYPAAQLKAIDEAIAAELALASKLEQEAAAKAKEDKYNGLIASADASFKSKDWNAAKSAYKEAQGVKPAETYPTSQLKAIDDAIAAELALASQQEQEAAARAKEEKYNEFIRSADLAFKSKDWETAKSDYKSAQGVKPTETYPGEQLKAIDAAIAAALALASKQEQEAAAREKEEKYKSLISSGDQAFNTKDWESARADYKEAQGVKPAETYPGAQLKAIDAAIAAEAALASQQEKEAALKAKEEKYNRLIASADKAFKLKDWQTAKRDYTEAQGVKPEEAYPVAQLKAIELEIANQGEQAKKEDYLAYITSADRAFKSKDWISAKTNYESALSVIPTESYPKDQLARIAEAMNNEKAIALKSEQDETYRQMIGDADQLFAVKDYQASKSKYKEALGVKPEEIYPKNQLAEIEKRLSEDAVGLAAAEKKYNEFIRLADNSFNVENYKDAKSKYEQALAIKDESYPRNRIEEIDAILRELEQSMAQNNEAKQKRVEFDKLIARADKGFMAKAYENAKRDYQSALNVIPGETYPKNKIAEIEKILSEQQTAAVPVVVPTRSASGKSDAEISAMMLKWQLERDQAKADRLNQLQKELKETSDDRVSSSDERRMESSNELTDLELALRESNKTGQGKNLEEASLLEDFRSDQKDFIEDKTSESAKKRGDLYAEIEETEMGQKELKEEGNQLYLVNTEKKITEKIELQNQNQEMSKEEDQRRIKTHGEIVNIEEDIRKDKENNMDRHMHDVERIEKDNEQVRETTHYWTKTSIDNRSNAYEEIVALEADIKDFKENNKESYKNNTQTYWKTVEELNQYASKKEGESLNNRNKAYNEIVDYSEDVAQVTQEKNNTYLDNSREILKDNMAIRDYDAQLAANADEKRLAFDRNFYTGEKKPRYPEKAKQFPQGVTEESYEEDDAFVVKRTVVEGENINEYQKIFYKWGGVYYKKNGLSTTEVIWTNETK